MDKKLFLLSLATIVAAPAMAQTTWISDFEAFTAPTNNGTVLFRQPTFSGSTSGKLDTAPDISKVVLPAGGVGGNTTNVLEANFSFKAVDTGNWLRLTTFNAANLGNPTVDFSQWLKFDVYSDHDIYIAVGLRETNSAADIGANGGTSGSLEWVCNDAMTGNTSLPGGGSLITAGQWVTYAVNLAAPPFVKAFTGNGVLESTTGKGVLEHIAIMPAAGASGAHDVYFDNFRQEAVPEPTTIAVLGLGALAMARRRRRA